MNTYVHCYSMLETTRTIPLIALHCQELHPAKGNSFQSPNLAKRAQHIIANPKKVLSAEKIPFNKSNHSMLRCYFACRCRLQKSTYFIFCFICAFRMLLLCWHDSCFGCDNDSVLESIPPFFIVYK